jgi:hypothetical protein
MDDALPEPAMMPEASTIPDISVDVRPKREMAVNDKSRLQITLYHRRMKA